MILNEIEDRIGNLRGKIGISYIDLTAGVSCFAGNCDIFPSSGMAKLMVLIEVFRQLDLGIICKEDKYVLSKEDCKGYEDMSLEEPSYGVLRFLHEGLELNMSDLINLMVIVSDNSAFNILLQKIGADNVNRTLRKNGFKDTAINRELFDWNKINIGVDNYHSVREVTDIF